MFSRSSVCKLLWLALPALTLSKTRPPHDDGSDLSFFISEPNIRAPKLRVQTYDEARLTPGFIFTAPYTKIASLPKKETFSPVQIGAHIYSSDGQLVWSGADLTHNFVVQDFRPVMLNNEPHLSLIFMDYTGNEEALRRTGLILNASFQVVQTFNLTEAFDIHEFNVMNDAKTSLRVMHYTYLTDNVIPGEEVLLLETCAAEIDPQGSPIFEFCPSEVLAANESYNPIPTGEALTSKRWDMSHMNSVEKFQNGDLLVSLRHTWGIYRVSRSTGDLLWRLGGKRSDFDQDFDFSWQHDARIVSQNDTVTVISFFDNSAVPGDEIVSTSNISSFKIVALYEKEHPMRAELLQEFVRPDGGSTDKRGNGRYLPSRGAFVCWSESSYTTEFAQDGSLIQEAKFESERLDTYRAYKAKFVGRPNTVPKLRTFASPNDNGKSSSTSYVSWNGATEVFSWTFFGSDDGEGQYKDLGTVPKTGFETSFVARHAWKYIRVYAKDAEGKILGESAIVQTEGLNLVPVETIRKPWSSNWNSTIVWEYRTPSVLIFAICAIPTLLVLAFVTRTSGPMSIRRLRRKISVKPYHPGGYLHVSQMKTTDH